MWGRGHATAPNNRTIMPDTTTSPGHESGASGSRIERLCVKAGLRMTGQRRTIAQVLTQSDDHPDVEEVHRRASGVDPRISLSTVYRTVRLFEQKGIIERHDFGEGRRRYEQAPREHHDHLVNIETGDVIEFRNEAIEQLQERVARDLGFELVGHRLELYAVPLPGRTPEPRPHPKPTAKKAPGKDQKAGLKARPKPGAKPGTAR